MKTEGRKFKLTVWFVLMTVMLLLLDKITSAQFVDLSVWTLSGYLGANVAHYGVAQWRKHVAPADNRTE